MFLQVRRVDVFSDSVVVFIFGDWQCDVQILKELH